MPESVEHLPFNLRDLFIPAGIESYERKKFKTAAKIRLFFIIPVLYGFTLYAILQGQKQALLPESFSGIISIWIVLALIYFLINCAVLTKVKQSTVLAFSFISIAAELISNEIIIFLSGVIVSHAFIFIILSIAAYRVFFDYRHSLFAAAFGILIHLADVLAAMNGVRPPEMALKISSGSYDEASAFIVTTAVFIGVLIVFTIINLGMNQVYRLRQMLLDNWKRDIACLENFQKNAANCADEDEICSEIVKTIQYMTSFQSAALLLSCPDEKLTVKALYGWDKTLAPNLMRLVDTSVDGPINGVVKIDSDLTGTCSSSQIFILTLLSGSVKNGFLILGANDNFDLNDHQKRLLTTLAENASAALSTLRQLKVERYKANTDVLTNLFNKRYFLEKLENAVKDAKTELKMFALIILDVDHFKGYNDSFGHVEGDRLLKIIAGTIAASVRPGDLVARFGGEEFVVLLTETDINTSLVIAQRIRQAVESLKGEDARRRVTISGGAAAFPLDADNATQLLECADKNLYLAKESGRNCIMPG